MVLKAPPLLVGLEDVFQKEGGEAQLGRVQRTLAVLLSLSAKGPDVTVHLSHYTCLVLWPLLGASTLAYVMKVDFAAAMERNLAVHACLHGTRW